MTNERIKANSRIGAYRIVRLLGQGGMGAVYEVVHEKLGVRYALKAFLQCVVADGFERGKYVPRNTVAQVKTRVNRMIAAIEGVYGEREKPISRNSVRLTLLNPAESCKIDIA